MVWQKLLTFAKNKNIFNLSKNKAAEIAKRRAESQSQMQSIYDNTIASVRNNELSKSLSIFEGQPAVIKDDIIRKFEMCSDEKIREQVLKILQSTKDGKTAADTSILLEAEELLDAVNVSQNMYSTLFNPRIANIPQIKLPKIIGLRQFVIKKVREYANKMFLSSETRKSWLLTKNKKKLNMDKFQEQARFANMRERIQQHPQDKELNEYLWKTYYLPYLRQGKGDTQSLINELLDIYNKTGSKIFFETAAPENKAVLNYLKKELDLFAKYSEGTANYPNIISINAQDSYFKICKAAGCYSPKKNSIKLNGIKYVKSFRHEMIHAQDETLHNGKSVAIKWTPDEIQELKKAGLTKHEIKYGEKESEAITKAGEADTSGYSDCFKEKLESLGLKKYVFLFPTKDKKVYDRILDAKYRDRDRDNLRRIRKAFGGEIPEAIKADLINNGYWYGLMNAHLKIKPNAQYSSTFNMMKQVIFDGIGRKLKKIFG